MMIFHTRGSDNAPENAADLSSLDTNDKSEPLTPGGSGRGDAGECGGLEVRARE